MSECVTMTHLHAERCSIASSCCGMIGEVTLTDSAIIILFAGMLGAGDMLSMITTSVLPFFNGLFIIPMAYFSAHLDRKRLIMYSCSAAAFAYFAATAAPFFGTYAVAVLTSMILLFSLSLTGFVAGWFPLLDTFLKRERRTEFLGRMRFFHQLAAMVFLFVASLLIGSDVPLWKLQMILVIGALFFLGRIFFIAKIPKFPSVKSDSRDRIAGLSNVTKNKEIIGFSIYQFMSNLAVFGTIPLSMLYLKNELKAPDNVIVLISSATLLGMFLGYWSAPRIIRTYGLKSTFLLLHVLYFPPNIVLFFIDKGSVSIFIVITGVLMLSSFTIAAASILTSAEMMALAIPEHKTISMAFCSAFYCGGIGLSRIITSLLLGTGLLSAQWHIGTMHICRYQTLFLVYAAGTLMAGIFLLLVPAIFHKNISHA